MPLAKVSEGLADDREALVWAPLVFPGISRSLDLAIPLLLQSGFLGKDAVLQLAMDMGVRRLQKTGGIRCNGDLGLLVRPTAQQNVWLPLGSKTVHNLEHLWIDAGQIIRNPATDNLVRPSCWLPPDQQFSCEARAARFWLVSSLAPASQAAFSAGPTLVLDHLVVVLERKLTK